MATVEPSLPPLEMGDQLTCAEFLRRWEAHPEIKRAELIGGIVYTASLVPADHGSMHAAVGMLPGIYMAHTPGCDAGSNATVFLLEDCVQPDVHMRLQRECGGASRVRDEYLRGPPEWVGEVCRSGAAYDLHQKLDVYQRAGVREYLAVLLYEQEIRWHTLVGDAYQVLPPDADGIWRSRVFPGLWLDGLALLKHDGTRVMSKLQEGIASPEHRAFVAELAARKSSQQPR